MTIRIPECSFGDRVLRGLGKRRGVIIPVEVYQKFGPYATVRGRKENFFRALFRSAKRRLPKGMIDLY